MADLLNEHLIAVGGSFSGISPMRRVSFAASGAVRFIHDFSPNVGAYGAAAAELAANAMTQLFDDLGRGFVEPDRYSELLGDIDASLPVRGASELDAGVVQRGEYAVDMLCTTLECVVDADESVAKSAGVASLALESVCATLERESGLYVYSDELYVIFRGGERLVAEIDMQRSALSVVSQMNLDSVRMIDMIRSIVSGAGR